MEQRVDLIVDLIKRRQQGGNSEQIKRETKAVLAHIRPEELRHAEQHLEAIGINPDELHELRTLHLSLLHQELEELRAATEPWHPVRTMIEEHDQILSTLDALDQVNLMIQADSALSETNYNRLNKIADNLLAAEPHHAREEEILFPELTKRNLGGPIQAMEEEHRNLRDKKQKLKELVSHSRTMAFDQFQKELDDLSQYLVFELSDHIYKENHLLYPAAVRLITDKTEWEQLKAGCDTIGYCNFNELH